MVGFIWSKEPVVPDRDDFPAIIQFYRKGLERTCSLSSIDFWGYIGGSVLVGTGFALAVTATWELLLGVVWLGIHWPVSTNTAKQSQATAADRSTAQ